MTGLPLLLAFVAAATVLTLTPGVDTAMVLRAAMGGGRRQAVMASIGIALGCLIWGASVALGLGVLLLASETAYTVLKFAGVACLVGLGVKMLLKPRTVLDADAVAVQIRDSAGAFWRGFLTNLLNPKVGVFYITFLPQFVPAGANVPVHTFLLACLHVLLSLLWFSVLIAATLPLSRFLRRPAALSLMDRLSGTVFIAFGARLAVSSAP